jgi:hypothetical protein
VKIEARAISWPPLSFSASTSVRKASLFIGLSLLVLGVSP